jgi:hypothetical protein
MAGDEDVVLICGKGHEDYIVVGLMAWVLGSGSEILCFGFRVQGHDDHISTGQELKV